MLVYCHVMESAFPLAVLRNLLLLLSGRPEDWVFHSLNKKGQTVVCENPSQKVREIKRLADCQGVTIGSVLRRLWNDTLRHRFSHAYYALTDSQVLSTRNLSPIAREAPMKFSSDPFITFDELSLLYKAALSFVSGFVSEYSRTSSLFQKQDR